MKKNPLLLILAAALLLLLTPGFFLINTSAQAAPPPQLTTFVTPTPGSDGRIVYIVQDGDTLWRIAAIAGMSVADLRDLNNLDPEDVVIPGQQLFLGLGGPTSDQPTPGPVLTATPAEPTSTPVPGIGTLCVLLYDDLNGDSMRQEEEPGLPGGAINISNRDGSVSITEDTPDSGGEDYFCVENLLEGEYNVSVAVPEGYNPTTVLNTAVEMQAGDTTYLTFGAQAGSVIIDETVPLPESTGGSPLVGIIGLIFLVGGIGLGVYAFWFRN